MAVVVTDMMASENNCGFINTKGEMVIEPIYDAKITYFMVMQTFQKV